MPEFCVELVGPGAQRPRQGHPRARASPILGVAYKPGVGDLRESPALKIMRQLDDRGAELAYHDDFVPELAAASSWRTSRWTSALRGRATAP